MPRIARNNAADFALHIAGGLAVAIWLVSGCARNRAEQGAPPGDAARAVRSSPAAGHGVNKARGLPAVSKLVEQFAVGLEGHARALEMAAKPCVAQAAPAAPPGGPAAERAPGAADWYTTEGDQQVTEALRQAFAADASLAADASEVRIHAFRGDVTLSGTVSSAALKDAFVKKAEALVEPGHLVDLLELP